MKTGSLTFSIFALSVCSSSSFAAEDRPPPPPEVKKTVDAFIGKSAMESTLTLPGQPAIKFKSVADCKKIAGGAAVSCHLTGKLGKLGAMDDVHLIGYDPESKKVRILSWTTGGEVHDHSGTWKDDTTMEVTTDSSQGGKPYKEVNTFTVDAKGKLTSVKSVQTFQDGSTVVYEGSTKKK